MKYLNLEHSTKMFSFSFKAKQKLLYLMKYQHEFQSLLKEDNEMFPVSYI